jgi:hypothetical protein
MQSESVMEAVAPQAAMERVRQSFEQWRRTRTHHCPIPAALWSAAVSLAREHGLAATARGLHLDYNNLKKRLSASGTSEAKREAQGPRFIELAVPHTELLAGECRIELDHPGGARMRIHYSGGAMPDLSALGRFFWGMGA